MKREAHESQNFRDLEVLRLGTEIALEVYRVTTSLPKAEAYGSVAQMGRAGVSIPSNIAEGFNRTHNKEYSHFLDTALGSCAELETQVELCCDLGYLDAGIRGQLLERLDHETRMLRNLLKRIRAGT